MMIDRTPDNSTQYQATLDIDLGNTRLKYRCGEQRGALTHDVAATDADLIDWVLPDVDPVRRVRACSVLSSDNNLAFARAVQERWDCDCEFARSSAQLAGVVNGYEEPGQLGVDRWLAMVAGYHQFAADATANRADRAAVLVADLGTAATLDYVTAEGRHMGGFIVPGAATMRQSLLKNTAAIRLSSHPVERDLSPGTRTRDAVERGVLLAMVRLLETELERFTALSHHNSRLILCGGGAAVVLPHLECDYTLAPELVLDGLAIALP